MEMSDRDMENTTLVSLGLSHVVFFHCVIVSVLVSSAVDRGFESNQRLKKWYLLFLCSQHSIKEKEQILVDSESCYCVRVGQHVYPRTVVSVS